MIRTIFNRIISDYFLFNKIANYEILIKTALQNGYTIMKHSDFYKLVKSGGFADQKILMIRHDIDTDPNYVYQWLEVEKKYNVNTSYYFRLCSLDKKAMNAVRNQGSDCGYHYEELATYVKQKALPLTTNFSDHFPEVRTMFEKNLKIVEDFCGFKMESIASHGDFMNRKIKMINATFVTPELLEKNGIDFEAYQSEFVPNYSINVMDLEYPKYFLGEVSPLDAVKKDYQVVHLLFHPKNWRTNWWTTTKENWIRLKEGINYRRRAKN